ncbi:MAG TPA: hypothetical protein VG407_10810 [Caulobacteraceae bacterium]|nr:hypothetical protein [Caulobacteraceae bacterium]
MGESTRLAFRNMAAEWRILAADAERREGSCSAPIAPGEPDKLEDLG